MAFNLLVELVGNKMSWNDINADLNKKSSDFVDVFPIPDFKKLGSNYIGISVINTVLPNNKIHDLKKIVEYFIMGGNKVFELYSGNEFFQSNLEYLADKFLKTE